MPDPVKQIGKKPALSVEISSLPFAFEHALRHLKELGFHYVDLTGLIERPASDCEALADSGLIVCCGAVGHGLPKDYTLDAPTLAKRRSALEAMERQVVDLARLGATSCSLTPGNDSSAAGMSCYREACSMLAGFAGQRMVSVCIEHRPASALPTAAGLLDWLQLLSHPDVGLLLDIRQCHATGEDPVLIAEKAGSGLGHVRLPCGNEYSLGEEFVRNLLTALSAQSYAGALALEAAHDSPDPLKQLQRMKEMIN